MLIVPAGVKVHLALGYPGVQKPAHKRTSSLFFRLVVFGRFTQVAMSRISRALQALVELLRPGPIRRQQCQKSVGNLR